jgi:hypothetical protein
MDVLYGEASPEASRRVETHHAVCQECRGEFEDMRAVRHTLAAWRLPEQPRARVAPPRLHPLASLAAAAGLLLVMGGALRLAGASFEYRVGEATLRLGGGDLERRFAEQEARYRSDLQALRASFAAEKPRAEIPSDNAVLVRVEQLIRENEQRQALRLNTSLEELAARAEAQRRYDLARVSAGLSYLDGKTGQHVARTSELMGYVLQASEKK